MYERILDNVSRHINLTEEETSHFTSLLQFKKLRKRQYLVQAGDLCRYECFVNKGCLRQYYVDEAGLEHILMFALEDWWTSDMYGLITGNPSLTNVDAIEDSELLLIPRDDFGRLLAEIPKFEKLYRIMLQRAFVAQQKRMIENMSLPAEERYKNLIEQRPDLELRIPQRYIASFLGITPESLSRIRRNLT